MSACVFYTDADGDVIGGKCLTDRSTREGWRFDCAPIKSLEEGGVAIAWPDGARWLNCHWSNLVHPDDPDASPERQAQRTDHTNETERDA